MDVLCFSHTRGAIKMNFSFHTLTVLLMAPCGAVQFIHLLFPIQIIVFAFVFIAFVGRLLCEKQAQTGFAVAASSLANTCFLQIDNSDFLISPQ